MLVDKRSGELFLYQPIGADFSGDGITAESFMQALDSLGGKRAIVRINSPGGSVFDGLTIYQALRRHRAGVDVVVDALCASIASVIALAGEKRTSTRGSMWMIHRAQSLSYGNSEDVQKTLSMLETGDKSLISIYAESMTVSPAKIEALMSAETWFTADEAVAIGLATKTDGVSKQQPQVHASWLRNVPQAMKQSPARVSSAASGGSVPSYRVPRYRYVAPLR